MAQKLNWKVAVIGIFVLVFLMACGAFVFMHYNKNPKKLLVKAEKFLAQALSETEALGDEFTEDQEEDVKEIYGEALNNYGGAYGATKDPDFKIEILFTIVDFHLLDNPIHPVAWKKAAGIWNQVLTIDPKNIEANKALLDYSLKSADSLEKTGAAPSAGLWKRIMEYSTELIAVMEEQGQTPDISVKVAKAKGMLVIALAGQTTDQGKSLKEAVAELEAAKKIDPSNIKVYALLAEAAKLQAQIDERNGLIGAIEDAVETQSNILEQAVEASPDNVQAYINLLKSKLISASRDLEKVEQLEADYVGLVNKFNDSPKAAIALANYYSLNLNSIDKAIENYSKAMELDRGNAIIANKLATTYFRKGTALEDISALEQAVEITDKALEYPNAIDVKGPTENANRMVRFGLLSLQAMANLELAYNTEEAEKDQWAEKLAESVYQIEQFFGSAENPQVLKWHGFLDVAKGDENSGITKLYSAYRQFRSTATVNDRGQHISGDLRYLPYFLSRVFASKNEVGLRKQFLEDALVNGIVQTAPQAWLDYAEILLASDSRQLTDVINITSRHNEKYPPSEKANPLLVRAYAMAGEYDKANELVLTMDPDAIETLNIKIQLLDQRIPRMVQSLRQLTSGSTDQTQESTVTQAEIDNLQKQRIDAIKKALDIEPESVAYPRPAFLYQLNHDQTQQAKELIDYYLARTKSAYDEIDSTYIQATVFSKTLNEPEPQKIPTERYQEIMLDTISQLSNAKQKNLALASFYNGQNDLEKSQEYLNAAFDIDPDDKTTITLLFNNAGGLDDDELMKKYADVAEEKNTDSCKGGIFKAKIDMTGENYADAIRKLDQCLEYNPTNVEIYLLRSRCYSLLKKHKEAIKDAKTAMQMNFLNGEIAQNYASIIFTRNSQLGSAVTQDQTRELEDALRIAITRNRGKWELMGMLAQQIAKRDPQQALKIRLSMAQQFPNSQTHLQLGNLALLTSEKEFSSEKKAALLQIAEKAFQDSYDIDPTSEAILNSFAEYYRVTGQSEKAAQLFAGKEKLLWQYHLRDGQTEKAIEILKKQYAIDPKDPLTLAGLITISQRMQNNDDLMKYTEELVDTDGSVENRLKQIQTLLNAGLIAESEAKLKEIKSVYPDEPKIMFAEAWLIFTKGKPQESLVLLNEYIKNNPNDAAALKTRGQINRTLENLNQAVNDLQKSAQIAPSPETQFILAQTHLQNENTAIAIGILKEIIKNGNASPKVRSLLESTYINNNRLDDLRRFYAETLAKYPDNPYWNLKAGQFEQKSKRYAYAEKLLLKSWETSLPQGGNPAALSQYLSVLIETRKFQQAQTYALKYIDGDFATIAYANLGMIQMKLQDKQKAIDYYYKSLEHAGDDDNLITNVLSNMQANLDSKVVSDWCNEKLAKDPASIAANITLFRMYQNTNDYDKALKYINKCLEATDKSDNQWAYFTQQKAMHLTIAYMKTNDDRFVKQAVDAYEGVLEKNPKNTDIMNNIAYLLTDNNLRLNDAVEYAKTAHESRPNDTNRMDTYAYTLSNVGEYQKAEELLLSAIAIHQQQGIEIDGQVYKHLADAQAGLEKNNEAIVSYNKYIELGADNINQKEKEQIQLIISNLKRN